MSECNKTCKACACTSDTDPADLSAATRAAIARAAEAWNDPDNTEAHRPALEHPLTPERKPSTPESRLAYGSLTQAALTFSNGLVTEPYLAELVKNYDAGRLPAANRRANTQAFDGEVIRLTQQDVDLNVTEYPLGAHTGVFALSGTFAANREKMGGYVLKEFCGEKYHEVFQPAARSFLAAMGEQDTLSLLANLNSEIASGNLTFFFEDTSTTTYALFTCEGTAVAGYSACIDVRNFCPLLGMVYSAKQVASKLYDRYVLSPRAGAMRRLQNQAWVCMGLARRFSA